MTISKNDVIYLLGRIQGIVDMGIKEDDQAIKDDVADWIDDILHYLEGE